MAQPQRSKTKPGKRVPAYSADAMALHLVGGLLLIALGVMIFLAVVLSLPGDVFAGLRQVCFGLAGGLAFLLPAAPIWGGVLIIMATQRRAPLRAFLLFNGLALLVLTAAELLSSSGNPAMPLMQYFLNISASRAANPAAYDVFLARAYELGSRSGMGGGLLGMLLAWPLWQLMGVIPSAILTCLMAAVDFLFLIRLDVKKLLGLCRQKAQNRRAQQDEEQKRLQAQQLAWQQEQQRQREQALAWQREQELAWQRQQEMAAQQNMPPENGWEEPYYAPQDAYAPQDGYPPENYPPENYPPENYPPQAGDFYGQMTAPYPQRTEPYAPRPAVGTPAYGDRGFRQAEDEGYYPPPTKEKKKSARKSKIFDRKGKENHSDPVREAPPEAEASRPSRIFGGKKAAQPAPASQGERWENPDMPTAEPMPEQREAPQPLHDVPPQAEPMQRPAQPRWQEEDVPARAAAWRAEEETPAEPAPRPVPHKVKQKPQPSWEETPPWEDAPARPAASAAVPVVSPKLQQEQPKDAWQPELKLPPRKAVPQPQQVEMELPPPYVYPAMSLLKQPEPQAGISPEEDAVRSQRLEETLSSFKVPAKVRHVTHGPAISRFELELAAGIKVTKVTDLGRNIAMNMEVKSVRIEAPIPGKSLVGVEVPNHKVSKVTLREVMESDVMRSAKAPLAVALGKDIAGTPIVCDLARMPHLLIAGATGSGKSVCINTMINSLLFRCSPHEVRMILVDPKVVELQCYNGIPHLLIPVVSDPHKAAGALAWAVAEMMDRYKKFEAKKVRAIDGYNAKLEDGEEFMPRIVIIIDELADLMMTCKREVEDHICRLAQLARAAGIHLVVATQRPSVDVITGLIKANIPSRIAFKVSSFIDSRTILDRVGAEQLLGWGDMLYLPTGEFTPIRVQGCFLSDGEVNRVTDFIRENCEAEYDPNVLEKLEQLERESAGMTASADTVDGAEDPNSDDSLLAQCIEMAVNDGQISTSLLQRRLKVGYARAGRLVDEMEKRGVVSAKDGAKPRMCLITREEYERMREDGDLDE